jgi:Undecaprenyl-phosphate glucose phosphotransferase
MSRRLEGLFVLITALVDAAMAAAAVYVAYWLRQTIPFPTALALGPFRGYVGVQLILAATVVLTFFWFRLYHLGRSHSRIDLFYSILSAVSIATIGTTALTYLLYSESTDLTRGLILYAWALTIVLTGIGRVVTGWLHRLVRRQHPDRLVLVGTSDVARMILQKTLQSPELGYQVIGFVDDETDRQEIAGVPIVGSRADLERVLREHEVKDVVITINAPHDEMLDLIAACQRADTAVRLFPDLFQIVASSLTIDDLDGLPLLTVRDVALRGWKLTLKRAMDLMVSGVGLVVISPLMMLIALIIKLESPGPVFFSQTRVGLDGKPFRMLKFRSMRVDAEADTGAVWAASDDPRRTRLGTLLRKLSLDELPQLINVFVGEMSLVGPRPERPIFVEQFRQVVPRYMERHQEKAGMTGWAQVNGLRGNTSIVERTKYDLYYVENWSLLFDLKIMLRTFVNTLRGDKNAY